MSKFFRCDGRCGRELSTSAHPIPPGGARIELTIERAGMSAGGGIPSGTSHLCAECARIAFAALQPEDGQ